MLVQGGKLCPPRRLPASPVPAAEVKVDAGLLLVLWWGGRRAVLLGERCLLLSSISSGTNAQ